VCVDPVQRFGSQLLRAGSRHVRALSDEPRRSLQGFRAVALSHFDFPVLSPLARS
jgi:hypothetical protein